MRICVNNFESDVILLEQDYWYQLEEISQKGTPYMKGHTCMWLLYYNGVALIAGNFMVQLFDGK